MLSLTAPTLPTRHTLACTPRTAGANAWPSAATSMRIGRVPTTLCPTRRVSRSTARRQFLPPQASWGAPVEWSSAEIVSNTPVGTNLHRVLVDIGPRASDYTRPGQYVQIKVGDDGKPGFFAIASAPDTNNQGVLELLIKNAGEAAEKLCALGAGAQVDASPVQGKGFPIERIPVDSHSTVLMFATGTGISPIKALIESGDIKAPERDAVVLYYGARSAEHMAYGDQLSTWEQAGVTVVPVMSEEGKGYVQDVFKANGSIEDPGKVGVVLCGHKDMCTAITEHLTAQGVDKEHILLNF